MFKLACLQVLISRWCLGWSKAARLMISTMNQFLNTKMRIHSWVVTKWHRNTADTNLFYNQVAISLDIVVYLSPSFVLMLLCLAKTPQFILSWSCSCCNILISISYMTCSCKQINIFHPWSGHTSVYIPYNVIHVNTSSSRNWQANACHDECFLIGWS